MNKKPVKRKKTAKKKTTAKAKAKKTVKRVKTTISAAGKKDLKVRAKKKSA
jgi:hypothetical protein